MARIKQIVRTSSTDLVHDAIGALAVVALLVTSLHLPVLF